MKSYEVSSHVSPRGCGPNVQGLDECQVFLPLLKIYNDKCKFVFCDLDEVASLSSAVQAIFIHLNDITTMKVFSFRN